VGLAFVGVLSATAPARGALVKPFGWFAAVDGLLALVTAACAVAVPVLRGGFASVVAADGLLHIAAAVALWLGPGIPDFVVTFVIYAGLAAAFAFYVGLLEIAAARRLRRRIGRNPVSIALSILGIASVAFGVGTFLLHPRPGLVRWMLMAAAVIKGLALLAIALREWPSARDEMAAA
jgi:hypothetical protein